MANPVTLAEVQQHLRLGTLDAAEQAEVEMMISAATEVAGSFCNRPWKSVSKTEYFDSFPSSTSGYLLVHGDIQSITDLRYYSTEHVEAPFIHYRFINTAGRTKVYPAFGHSWPTNSSGLPASISLTYIGGDEANVPSSVKSAILLMVGDLYENRENTTIDAGISSVRMSVTSEKLLTPYKTRIA